MILCCGEALIDFLPRKTAEGAAAYEPVCGGSVYNTAIALGRLGVPVGLFTGLSTDFFGDMLRDGLKASNVSLAFIKDWDRPSTLAFVKLSKGHARYSFFDDALEALMKREAKSRVICLDPNIRPGMIKDRRKHMARLTRMIAMADIVKVSDEDVAWMTAKDDAAAAAKRWLKLGAKLVVVTRGA